VNLILSPELTVTFSQARAATREHFGQRI